MGMNEVRWYPMRRSFTVALTGALLLLGSLVVASPAAAATIASVTTCSNGVDDTPGLGLICQVSVVNTITAFGGSAKVTVRECHGSAGAPTAKCSTRTVFLGQPVTRVRQCNNATNGGGGTLRCSVKVTNDFIGVSPGATNATVNQCVGSGGGIANNCDPFPATTTNATITQCNGSANGGTLVNLNCSATGTKSSAFSVTVNQCNNSTNGGGALVHCSADIVNRAVTGVGSGATAPTTSTLDEPTPPGSDESSAILVVLAFLVALMLSAIYLDRRVKA
jgi:hypothetical protein